jgi:tetratricopeptide (TPR) repeat protein
MPKRKKSSSAKTHAPEIPSAITVTEYEITSEAIIDRAYKRLPENVKDSLEQLYTLAETRPRQAIPELETLLHTYPHIPKIYNYLSVAYSAAGEQEKAKHLVEENYRRHPEYLFARLNYAEIYLQKGDYAAIPAIFEHKFDLKLLYPKRKRFHVSEMIGFMGVIGPYFYAIGERALAENAYDILRQLAPHHTYTKRLKRLLYPNFFQRLFQHRSPSHSDND